MALDLASSSSTFGGSRERAARRRAAVRLCRARLRATFAGRAAWSLAIASSMGAVAVALALRLADGPRADLDGLVPLAAALGAWLSGAPLAIASAADRAASDRRDGIEALALGRGISADALASSRVVASAIEIAIASALPAIAAAITVIAASGSFGMAIVRLRSLAGAALVAVVLGVTLGLIASVCGRIAGARGRSLFLAVVMGPWVALGLVDRAAWSIPGALAALIDLVLGAGGVG